MDDEIDLRAYAQVLLRRWWWIVGMAVAAAALGFIYSLLQPVLYEASSVVIVTRPRYQMQFDSRFANIEQPAPAYKAFPTLATSDAILQAVRDGYAPPADSGIEAWNLPTLSKMVQADSAGDPSLVMLKVKAQSPEAAAGIANLWADLLVRRGNEVYGENVEDVSSIEAQTEQANRALAEADAALIAYQSRNQAPMLEAQLRSQEQAQESYLSTQISITHTIQDIQGLRDQLTQLPSDQPASLADSLTVLLLQIKAFNAQASTPIQLQVSEGEPLATMSREEQIALLGNLNVTLQNRSADINAQLAALGPQILAVQQKLQEAEIELDRLASRQELAKQTYLTLARKLDEARIASQTESGALQVGSYAAVPERPVSPRKVFNSALSGMIGLMLGVFVVFAVEWWRQ